MNLFQELKRRKVFKTVGVYAAASLIIIQVTDIVFPRLLLPDWTVTFVIVLVIIGFPITFFLSWTYDLKHDDTDINPPEYKNDIASKKGSLTKKILFPLTGLILTIIGGAFWFIYPFLTIGMGDEKEYDASIAILYMENISPDEKSYFADGLTEELITRLSRIQNLKVRPRTDVAFFKNKIATMDEISKKLSVNYIVEGSVKIIDDNLRVNVSLFDIDKDDVTWSDSYNNILKDILNVQDEIANSIVSKLNEKLTITKSDLIATEQKSTENLEAYNLVMNAFQHINNPIYTERKLGEIIGPLAQKAIKLDSTYSDAYAISALAKLYKWMDRPTVEGTALREEEINDQAMANFHANTALHYDENNILASVLFIIISTQWDMSYELSDTQKIINARNMMIETKRLLNKNPDNIFCQTVYAFIQLMKNNILNAEDEEYQEPLDRMLKVHQKLKNNNFVYNHPTEKMAVSIIFEFVPQLYARIGKGNQGMQFVKDNKHNFCSDGTYNCLNTDILVSIGTGFYQSFDYENALEIINLILSQSEENLLSVGNTIDAKKQPYYRSGMIYMKWGDYDKAIDGFTKALKLSYKNEDDQWWNAHYYRRLGLVYFYKGDYINASKNYLESYRLSETLDDYKKYSIKALCSYGYVEQLLGNHNLAKEKMSECSSWVLENRKEIEDDHDTYETIWPLYLYQKQLKQQNKASKYLLMAYEIVGKRKIEKYHTHTEKDTDPYFFYCRDIIKAYESNLNQ
jgi:TolB-like protein/tetratricopeptide (TPR) repeat protein